jgi:hypothetical protein
MAKLRKAPDKQPCPEIRTALIKNQGLVLTAQEKTKMSETMANPT